MSIFAPPRPHATTQPNGYCRLHEQPEEFRKGRRAGPRLWRISGALPVEAVVIHEVPFRFPMVSPPEGLSLAPGTRLRLDALSGGGRYYDGGEHTSTNRRFCVLDGPLAGTCWHANESVWLEDGAEISDPVEPLQEAAGQTDAVN